MSHRLVHGLKWAEARLEGPGFKPHRARGAKAQGLRYERQLARALPAAKHGLWFQFEDANGPGWCQPDLLLGWNGALVVLEAKYTWVPEGHSQVEQLYRPVVEAALKRPVVGLVVCHTLTPQVGGAIVVDDLGRAMEWTFKGYRVVLHWLGDRALPLPALMEVA